ncbi:hypothetical protein HanIR_Chr12g0586161 [Helianthus annuus]|nr:hypothetical protein HanIR_Chr12g0586161 [Helianthus annuus]
MRWVEAVEKKEAAAAAAAMVLILGFFFLRIAIPVLCVKCRNHPPFVIIDVTRNLCAS